jgi:hypothetical protein
MELETALLEAQTTKRSRTFVRFAPGRDHLKVLIFGLNSLYGNVLMETLIDNPPESDPDWHRGEPCIYAPGIICVEGWCRDCGIAQQHEGYREMRSGAYWDCMEDRQEDR